MKTTLWFAICIFGWGIGAFVMAHLGRTLTMGTVLVGNLIGYVIGVALLARGIDVGWTWNHALAVSIGVLFVAGNFAFYRLSHAGEQVSILAPLTSLYVLVAVLLGALLWHEPITLRKALGVALAGIALILLSWER